MSEETSNATTNALDITDAYALEMRGTFDEAEPIQHVGKNGQYEVRNVFIKCGKGGKYSRQFEFFGDAIPAGLDDIAQGEEVIVRFYISQREYNGRVFTKLSGKSIFRANAADGDAEATEDLPDDAMPF